ncbi:MAG: hypothetical protein ACLPY1_07595 [Terracidiphilus sp.]
MQNKSQIEIERKILSRAKERKILSRIKTEMDQPRLTASVRNGFSAQAAPTGEKPAPRFPRA